MHLEDITVLFSCVDEVVSHVDRHKRYNATTGCASTLSDLHRCHHSVSLPLASVAAFLLRSCRDCLHRQGIVVGAVAFCLRVLHTICGHTIHRQLVVSVRPFSTISVSIRRAQGQTLQLRSVGGLRGVIFHHQPTLAFTGSVFLLPFCYHNVSFISTTCLHGDSIHSNFVVCQQEGAGRLVGIGVISRVTAVLSHCAPTADPCLLPVVRDRRATEDSCHYNLRQIGQTLRRVNRELTLGVPLAACISHRA